MAAHHIAFTAVEAPGTVLYVAADGTYLGAIAIADTVKPAPCAPSPTCGRPA